MSNASASGSSTSSGPSSRAGGVRSGAGARLRDPWVQSGWIPLGGTLERTSFSSTTVSLATGLLSLALAILLFQVIVVPIALGVQLAVGGHLDVLEAPDAMVRIVTEHTKALIVSNSVGQWFGLALIGVMAPFLHTTRWADYLRLRRTDVALVGLALAGIVVAQPIVQWLGAINQLLPLPDLLQQMEQGQMELIQRVLQNDFGLVFSLAMMAVTPGICEEVLFRGYAQRQFERGAGPVMGILLSGLLFGLYHLRLSQVLPLAFLGGYLAYLTWRTGSLWPAILGHILHNGMAIVVATMARDSDAYDLETLESSGVPWYAVVIGVVLFSGVVYVLHHWAPHLQPSQQTRRETRDGADPPGFERSDRAKDRNDPD